MLMLLLLMAFPEQGGKIVQAQESRAPSFR
jgi:hypothetical protein